MTDVPTPHRLTPRPWMTASSTRAVMAALQQAGGPGCARFVGGCVRDSLLDRERTDLDIDIATQLTPTKVVSALERAGLKAVPTGIDHGTVTAVAQGRPFEITTLRRDVLTDGRHAAVAFSTDWAQDAARRDFTLNTLYLDADGRVYDPTGEGVADALAGRIVFVGDPQIRIREDYLRVLRYFRFMAGYGRGAPDASALAACAALKDGLRQLSGERIAKELLKLLAADDPRDAMRSMAQTGVLGVMLPGSGPLSRFDRLVEIQAMEERRDADLRLAALLPDDRAAVVEVSARLRLANVLRDRLLAACAGAFAPDLDLSDHALRLAVYRQGSGAVLDRIMLAWAAAPPVADDAPKWRRLISKAKTWTAPVLPVTGAQIRAVGVPQGPEIGALLRQVEAWWIADDFRPDHAAAMDHLAKLMQPQEPPAETNA